MTIIRFVNPVSQQGVANVSNGQGGYEFTAGFEDRGSGLAGQVEVGTDVFYTTDMAASGTWYRFGFSPEKQVEYDVPYWSDPTPEEASGVGLFGGSYMPPNIDTLVDYDFYTSSYNGTGLTNLGDPYTEASGSFDFRQCRPGDLAEVRFDFNVVPQIANTTVEVGLIWQTRDADDNPTFTFTLSTTPLYYGVGSVGNSYLNRPVMTAYFASQEDVNARALLAVKADNPVVIQPLTTLVNINR